MIFFEILQLFPLIGYVVSGIFGLIIGSFLTFITYRIRHKKPWLWGREAMRSQCPSCGHVLAARDLIPVLSWVISGGKCRYCGCKIPVRYPLIEVKVGCVFIFCYHMVMVF